MSDLGVEEKKRSFSITHTIKDFASLRGEEDRVETHFGISWYIHVIRNGNQWIIDVYGDKEKLGEQRHRISVQVSLCYLSPSEVTIVESPRQKLSDRAEGLVLRQSIDHALTLRAHSENGNVTIRCDITLHWNFPPPKLDFSTPSDEVVSDVVLIVENREFKVSRMVLASFSVYFRTMFSDKFREAKDPIIPLEDVDADEFQELLDVIYHKVDITLENARELLAMITYFDINNLKDKCEKVLVASPDSTVSPKEKLLLADKYVLPELLEKCMKSFNSTGQLTAATPRNVKLLSPSTIERLFQRVVDLN